MSVLHLTEEDFEQVISGSDLPVLVDFWAAWCGPCQRLSTVIDQLADELEGRLIVAKVDVDAWPSIASRLNIASIPTLMIFQNGEQTDRLVGAVSKESISSMIERAA